MTGKHKPTTPANREAYLRHLAEELLREAGVWGYSVAVVSHAPGSQQNGPLVNFTPLDKLVQPSPLLPRTRSA